MVSKVISTNTFGVAKFVVSADATQGTHTTIQSAINDAVTGDSILVRAGSYNESLTLKGGVTIFTGLAQGSPNIGQGGVILTQGCTLPLTGQCTFQGFYFSFGATSNMFLDQAAGAPSLFLYDCGWAFSSGTTVFKCDNGQTNISLYNCIGSGTAQFYSIASGGTFQCYNSNIQAPGGTPTASSAPSGSSVYYFDSQIGFPTNLTAATMSCCNSFFYTSSSSFPAGLSVIANNTLITTATSGTYEFKNCQFISGTASAISVGSGTTVKLSGCCDINSSNTNAITGAGTLQASNINFSGTSSTTNVTTQTMGAAPGLKGVGPATGYLGEQIRSVVASVAVATGTNVNITSISLTPGTWDVSGIILFSGGGVAVTGTQYVATVNTVSATLGTTGDNTIDLPTSPTATANTTLSIPSWRVSVTATTTCYLIARALYTAGTLTAFGRISATRVG